MTGRYTDHGWPDEDGSHAADYYDEHIGDDGTSEVHHADSCVFTEATIGDDRIDVRVQGRAPQNEEDGSETCRRLALALAAQESVAWAVDAMRSLPPGVDGYIRGARDARHVAVQVTRVGSPDRWKALNTTGEASSSMWCDEAAAEIWSAIERKRLAADRNTILALRGQPGVHAVRQVVQRFQRIHGSELPGVGYLAIWLIGSSSETHFCLYPDATIAPDAS